MTVEHYAPEWVMKKHPSKRREACCHSHGDVIESHNAHYNEVYPQPIEVINEWLTDEQFNGFCLGTALKYLGRYNLKAKGKGGIRDIEKAIDYLEWMKERHLLSTKR